ncbi:MAG: amino acid adenylation domain-containing protein, partial [Desulfobacterales bacterium]|nr:amino acid adenylation domain-containing protein [Desulfobacterales bacterium]
MSHTSEHTRNLSAREKREALARMLEEKAGRAQPARHPLSHGQRALWFLHQSAPESAAYNTAFTVRLRSPVDVAALERTFRKLMARHPSLRTTFSRENGEPVQEVHARGEIPVETTDASGWSNKELKKRVTASYRRPFDLERGPVLRVSLFTRSEKDHVLLLAIHHIVCDAWSIWLLVEEAGLLLGGETTGEPAAPPAPEKTYADFVKWQAEMVAGPEGEKQWAYWKKQLSGEIPAVNLPADKPHPPTPTWRGASHFFKLEGPAVRKLRQLSMDRGVTLYMTLLAAFQVLLHRFSGQKQIIVGSPAAGRTRTGFAGTAGYFVNPTPLRADFSEDPGFDAFLDRVRQTVLDAMANQDYPFPLLVEKLRTPREAGRSPLFQTLFVFQKPRQTGLAELLAPGETGGRVNWGGLRPEPYEIPQMEGQFDLTMEIMETGESLPGVIKYSPDLFDPPTIRRLEESFRVLLEGVAARPDQRVSRLPLLTPEERRRLLTGWNDTRKPYPLDRCLHRLFEERVRQNPDAPAVEFRDRRLTYRELNARANQLAHRLRAMGVGPDVLVGVSVERSLEMVVGLYAILKAGGAYVPMDPGYPGDRLAYMMENADAPILLTQEKLADRLPRTGARIIRLDADRDEIRVESDRNPRPADAPAMENLAYMIYTSGSTGNPKGVMNTHLGIVNRLLWMQDEYRLTPGDRVMQKTPFSFDVSVWEFFWPLLFGARLVVAEPGGHMDSAYLVDLIQKKKITTLHFVPSMLQIFLEADGVEQCHSLKRVICSGEALPPELQERFFQRLANTELHNLYGPTEAAVDVTYWECRPDNGMGMVPIGRPIANTRIHILDRHLQPVPVGVPGELHIGGLNLARGYLNRPNLTREKFIPDPFHDDPGIRLYKTGDLCRYLADGAIQYLGRMDHQVKIRGFRVELGEIENALAAHASVKETVVTAREEGPTGARLIAYAAPIRGETLSPDPLRRFLKERLPDYMIPSAFVIMDALPLSPNGKVDRKALPEPGGARPELEAEWAPPRTGTEKIVAEIWEEALGLDKVGVHDNFFDLGGHSLLLEPVIAKLKKRLGRAPALVEMFQHPTIHTLAGLLTGEKAPDAPEPPGADSAPRPGARGAVPGTGSRKGSRRGSGDGSRKGSGEESRRGSGKGSRRGSGDVAIIGMACRFPGADNVDAFWRNLRDGVESITFFTDEELLSAGVDPALLQKPNYVKAAAMLPDMDKFDAAFFGFTPREAEIMDPQHRLFLECAWSALENAGRAPGPDGEGDPVGVFAGCGMNTYLLNNLYPNRARLEAEGGFPVMISNDKDFLPTRVSYKLNLTGPSINVQTACSTSLAAVHLARASLLNGECDMALAGGVNARPPRRAGYLHQEGMILSPDGRCRAFDADARGTIGANGVGAVVLKKLDRALADGDPVHAVIKGSAINNDGSLKVGYTAPGAAGQAAVISEAMEGIPPESITLIEAHGTGTPMGDPVEIAALTRAFAPRTAKKGFCAIGSVKSNFGHLDAAAGVAGLIKATLALAHQTLPPSLHFREPNPEIDFENSPFFVNTRRRAWRANRTPRRAGVSSFGIGGANVHVVLEEAPDRTPGPEAPPPHLLVVSAKTAPALETAVSNLADHLRGDPRVSLADAAHTLQMGRREFKHRWTAVCETVGDAVKKLRNRSATPGAAIPGTAPRTSLDDPSAAFMFSGQGAQHVHMAAEIYERQPVFRKEVDLCCEILRPHLNLDLRELLYPDSRSAPDAGGRLAQTALAQPALFVIECALAELWISWGVRPRAMIGHSIGEYAAARLSGVFTREDALAVVAAR